MLCLPSGRASVAPGPSRCAVPAPCSPWPALQPLQGDKETVEGVVKGLLDRCLNGKSYGDR